MVVVVAVEVLCNRARVCTPVLWRRDQGNRSTPTSAGLLPRRLVFVPAIEMLNRSENKNENSENEVHEHGRNVNRHALTKKKK